MKECEIKISVIGNSRGGFWVCQNGWACPASWPCDNGQRCKGSSSFSYLILHAFKQLVKFLTELWLSNICDGFSQSRMLSITTSDSKSIHLYDVQNAMKVSCLDAFGE